MARAPRVAARPNAHVTTVTVGVPVTCRDRRAASAPQVSMARDAQTHVRASRVQPRAMRTVRAARVCRGRVCAAATRATPKMTARSSVLAVPATRVAVTARAASNPACALAKQATLVARAVSRVLDSQLGTRAVATAHASMGCQGMARADVGTVSGEPCATTSVLDRRRRRAPYTERARRHQVCARAIPTILGVSGKAPPARSVSRTGGGHAVMAPVPKQTVFSAQGTARAAMSCFANVSQITCKGFGRSRIAVRVSAATSARVARSSAPEGRAHHAPTTVCATTASAATVRVRATATRARGTGRGIVAKNALKGSGVWVVPGCAQLQTTLFAVVTAHAATVNAVQVRATARSPKVQVSGVVQHVAFVSRAIMVLSARSAARAQPCSARAPDTVHVLMAPPVLVCARATRTTTGRTAA
eukprot:PhM_4_TR291/c0_g1_i1/m.27829